jgi:(p)ppGpp synthase/HD superfamily hydrolase
MGVYGQPIQKTIHLCEGVASWGRDCYTGGCILELPTLQDYEMSLVLRAARFAAAEHRRANHFRKHSGEPYIVHPARVAGRIAWHPKGTEEMVAAAWLHDTLEDCGTELEALAQFGPKVADLVVELTNPSKQYPHLSRSEKKRKDREHLASVSDEAKMIKIVDRIDNLKDFHMAGQYEFLQARYLPESTALYEVIKGCDLDLANEMKHILDYLEGVVNGCNFRHQ